MHATRTLLVAALALALGCDDGAIVPEAHAAPAGPSASGVRPPAPRVVRCGGDVAYPPIWNLAEASAAAEVELRPGDRAILALADSDRHGEAMLWHLPRGPLEGTRLLQDDAASDDIEGAAWAYGHLYTLTSSGAIRRYTASAAGTLARDRDSYPLGPRPFVCDSLRDGNCGKNYEGLCLRAAPAAPCAGYAASKTEGSLYCVVVHGDALAIDTTRPALRLDLPHHALSDCAFGSAGGPAEGVLVVTTNLYGGSRTYVVDETSGGLTRVEVPGLLSNEAVAVDHDGALYQFVDANTGVSATSRATCTGWGRP